MTKFGADNIKEQLCKDIIQLTEELCSLRTNESKYNNLEYIIQERIDEIPPESRFEDISEFYIYNIDSPLLAPYNYIRSFEQERSNAIRFMSIYLNSSADLRSEIRIKPLKHFMESPWAFEVFRRRDNLRIFLNDVLIEISSNKNQLIAELRDIGLAIEYFWDDTELEGGFSMQINFSLPDKSSHMFEYKELRDLIDPITIDRISCECTIKPSENDPAIKFEIIRREACKKLSQIYRNIENITKHDPHLGAGFYGR